MRGFPWVLMVPPTKRWKTWQSPALFPICRFLLHATCTKEERPRLRSQKQTARRIAALLEKKLQCLPPEKLHLKLVTHRFFGLNRKERSRMWQLFLAGH